MVPIIFRFKQVPDCASHELGDVARCKLLHHPFVWRRGRCKLQKLYSYLFSPQRPNQHRKHFAAFSLENTQRDGCNSDAQLDVIKIWIYKIFKRLSSPRKSYRF